MNAWTVHIGDKAIFKKMFVTGYVFKSQWSDKAVSYICLCFELKMCISKQFSGSHCNCVSLYFIILHRVRLITPDAQITLLSMSKKIHVCCNNLRQKCTYFLQIHVIDIFTPYLITLMGVWWKKSICCISWPFLIWQMRSLSDEVRSIRECSKLGSGSNGLINSPFESCCNSGLACVFFLNLCIPFLSCLVRMRSCQNFSA